MKAFGSWCGGAGCGLRGKWRGCAVLMASTLLAAGMLSGCGGGAKTPPPPPPPLATSVSISPTSALVDQGATVQFSASVIGSSNQAVAWSIQEAGGGSITQAGLYTAPAAAMEVHVIATSVADPSKSSTALVTVRAVSVSMPLTAAVPRGRQRQFTAVVTGTVVPGVTWTVDEGAAGGSITVDGVYTAPTSGGPFHVTARALGDPSKAATATVFLTDAGFRLLNSSLVEPRIAPTVTLLPNGKVLIAGGSWCSANGVCNISELELTSTLRASAELFDPVTETFSATGSMSVPRTGHTATLLNNGTVLVTGGANPDGESHRTAEIYNPATGSFTFVGNMAEGRVWHSASLLGDGRVLVAGGGEPVWFGGELIDTGSTQTAEIYDPTTQSFSPAGDLPKGVALHTASVLLDGTVLVVGGHGNSCPTAQTAVAIFDPASNSFSGGVSLPSARAQHTATTLNDGRVLITGGSFFDFCDFGGEEYDTAVVFDPATPSFSAEKFMREQRSGHSATLLADGKVLVVGSMAELFDPATSTFVIAADPNVPRGGRRAIRLADGRVLFVGSGSTAEIYE